MYPGGGCGHGQLLPPYAPRPISASASAARWKPGGGAEVPAPNCPRCDSSNTKFCYYNNYSLMQPRYFCKGCRRYWTKGGSLRNVPVGGGCRKNRRGSAATPAASRTQTRSITPVRLDSAGVSTHRSPDVGFLRPDLALEGSAADSVPPVIHMAAMYSRYLTQNYFYQEGEAAGSEFAAASAFDRNDFACESSNDNYGAAEAVMGGSCYYYDIGSFGSTSSPPPPLLELGDDFSSTTSAAPPPPAGVGGIGDWSSFVDQSSFEYYLYTI